MIPYLEKGHCMPIEFKTNMHPNYFFSVWKGKITDEDIMVAYTDFYSSDCWEPGQHELSDLTEADLSETTAVGFRNFQGLCETFFRQHNVTETKSAVIASKDLAYGLARMYSLKADNSPEYVRVFRDHTDAVEWLTSKD
jgi:hypothetical protein